MDETVENQQCPYCGKKMENGYITTAGGAIGWQKNKKIFDLKVEKIFPAKFRPKGAFHDAMRCKQCKVIQFSY